MLNHIVLIGRLTQDPELRYTQSGIAMASFTLAVDRRFKNSNGEKETDFINIVVWRQLAELCSNYLSKGKMACVEGSLQMRKYQAKDGTNRTVAEVVADNVEFLSPKEGGSNGSYSVNSEYSQTTQQSRQPKNNSKRFSEEESPFGPDDSMVGDEDLPF